MLKTIFQADPRQAIDSGVAFVPAEGRPADSGAKVVPGRLALARWNVYTTA